MHLFSTSWEIFLIYVLMSPFWFVFACPHDFLLLFLSLTSLLTFFLTWLWVFIQSDLVKVAPGLSTGVDMLTSGFTGGPSTWVLGSWSVAVCRGLLSDLVQTRPSVPWSPAECFTFFSFAVS
jgi:hypothetical protein